MTAKPVLRPLWPCLYPPGTLSEGPMPCGPPAAFMKHSCRECGRGGSGGTGPSALQQGQALRGPVCLVQVPAGGLSGTQQPCCSDPTCGACREGDFTESVRWNTDCRKQPRRRVPQDETIHSSPAPGWRETKLCQPGGCPGSERSVQSALSSPASGLSRTTPRPLSATAKQGRPRPLFPPHTTLHC